MQANYATFMNLGRAALADPGLISNHLEHNVPNRLRKAIEDNLIIIDAIGSNDPLFTQGLAAECVDALPILINYMNWIGMKSRT